MKRLKRVDLGRLAARVDAVRPRMPAAGMTLAEFEALALRGVAPPDVLRVVGSLHNRKAIYVRRNRGEVRVFAARPERIAGVFDGPAAADALLASAIPHVRRLAGAVAAREAAKTCGDHVEANAARDRLDVSAARLVGLVHKHEARGLPLTEVRRTAWAVFAPEVMEYLAIFEPSLARDATSGLTAVSESRDRIANGLEPMEKVHALIEKSGRQGMTKTGLYQAIRPKPSAAKLGDILDRLLSDGLIVPRDVRVRGSQFATRFFGVERAKAA